VSRSREITARQNGKEEVTSKRASGPVATRRTLESVFGEIGQVSVSRRGAGRRPGRARRWLRPSSPEDSNDHRTPSLPRNWAGLPGGRIVLASSDGFLTEDWWGPTHDAQASRHLTEWVADFWRRAASRTVAG
jgi:hypothetical protein